MKAFYKITKKLLVVLLVASVLLTKFSSLSYAATIEIAGQIMEYVTQSTDVIPSKAGDKVIVTVRIQNEEHDMANLKVSPSVSNPAFFVTGGYSATLVKKGEAVELTLSGTYKGEGESINCKIEYSYNGNNYIQNEASVGVVTSPIAPSGLPQLMVPNVISTISANASGNYTVKLPLKNNGSGVAKNIVITPSFEGSPFKANSDIYRVETISANATTDVSMEFSAKQGATKGIYSIPIAYTYFDVAGTSYSGSYTIYAQTGQGKTAPNLMVTNLKVSDSAILAGDKFNITYELKNTGQLAAYDVKVKVTGFGKETFIPSGVTTTNVFSQINSLDTKAITYSLTTSPTIIGDIYPVDILVTFKDTEGKEYTDTSTVYITAGAATSSIGPKLVIQGSSQDKKLIQPGSDFNMVIKLNNKGAQTAKNVKVTLAGFSTSTFIPKDKSDYKFVKDIDGSKTLEVIFPISAVDTIAGGMHELALTVEYTDASGQVLTEQSKVYITDVQGTTVGSPKGTPKIIISSFNVDTGVAKAGQQINFGFSFKNTSTTKALSNMKITLTSPEGVFTVIEGSNTYYIKSVGVEQVVQKTMGFDVKTDAVSGSYPLNILFEYEDAEGTSYQATEIIYMPVDELAKPVINRIDIPGYAEAYSMQVVGFEFFNMGKSKLNNVQASIEGGLTPIKSLTYIGNIEPGKGDIYEIEVMCDMAGEVTGTLVVSYEDSRGQLVETRQDFTMLVQEPYIPPFPEDPGIPIDPIETIKKPVLPVPAIIGLEIVLFIIALIVTKGIIVSNKKKKLRKEQY